jgi:hypothetical protein
MCYVKTSVMCVMRICVYWLFNVVFQGLGKALVSCGVHKTCAGLHVIRDFLKTLRA